MKVFYKKVLPFCWFVGLVILFICVVDYTLSYSCSPGEEQRASILNKVAIYGLIPATMLLLNINGMNIWTKVQWYKIPVICGVAMLFLNTKIFFSLKMSPDLIKTWILYCIPEAIICVCLVFIYTKIYLHVRRKKVRT